MHYRIGAQVSSHDGVARPYRCGYGGGALAGDSRSGDGVRTVRALPCGGAALRVACRGGRQIPLRLRRQQDRLTVFCPWEDIRRGSVTRKYGEKHRIIPRIVIS